METIPTGVDQLDSPVFAADLLVDSGLFDFVTSSLGSGIAAMPSNLGAWLAPEARTPINSSAPALAISEPGLWNGVVFFECNEPSYWLIVKAAPGRRRTDSIQGSFVNDETGFGEMHHQQPVGRSQTTTAWSEQDIPFHSDPAWGRGHWPRR
jgi:hypothetical protein